MEANEQRQMMELFSKYRAEETRESWLNRETKRNHDNLALFEAVIRLAFPAVTMVVAGHHLLVMCEGMPAPIEIASADTLLFDHVIAKAVWGDDWLLMLSDLAVLPVEVRDKEMHDRFATRWPDRLNQRG